MHAKSLQSCPTLCDPNELHVACQDPLSMGFSRQKYWGGLPSPPPGDLPDPGIESPFLVSPALPGRFFLGRQILYSGWIRWTQQRCSTMSRDFDDLQRLFLKQDLFIYFWLHWVFLAAQGLSPVATRGDILKLWCASFSLHGFSSWFLSSCSLRSLECWVGSWDAWA